MQKDNKNLVALVVFVIISFSAGMIGNIFTSDVSFEIYKNLVKPNFAPPSWIFEPIWTTLYLLIGVAAFLIWREGANKNVVLAMTMFFVQLFLNAIWTPVFFGFGERLIAFYVIIVLWVIVLITTIFFFGIKKVAGYLFLVYLLWISFALVLNYSIWRLNV